MTTTETSVFGEIHAWQAMLENRGRFMRELIDEVESEYHDLFQEFQWMIDEQRIAGDAVIARGMDAAIHEGYRIGVRI